MKTLKKTLCLVLAMVMVFGLCAVSASAKLDSYTDKDDITYAEAVDVMSGIGILQGDERGFRPTDNITRAEAAKIIAYIMVGNAGQADALKAGSDPFTDVPVAHWASGYISYCATAGIIGGMGDGTFRPSENVTGLQFAKMLLCALGYGQNDEYVGTDWLINTSRDALRLGIFDGNLAGATDAPATREECALYAFNVIAGTDDYTGIGKVSYSALLGGYINNSSTASGAPDANKASTFGGDFELAHTRNRTDKYDEFGRIDGYYWYVKKTTNRVTDYYVDSDKLKNVYTTKVTGADIYELLGDSAIEDAVLKVYVNSDTTDSAQAIPVSPATLTDTDSDGKYDDEWCVANFKKDKTETLVGTGNGTETYVYAWETVSSGTVTKNIRICVIDTYMVKVATVTKATATKDAKTTVNFLGQNTSSTDPLYGTVNEFKTEEFAKDDYVLITVADGDIQTMVPAVVIESEVTRFNQKNATSKSIVVDGETYVAAKNDVAPTGENALKASAFTNAIVDGKDHKIYVDNYGYVIGAESIKPNNNYVYVAAAGTKIDDSGKLSDKKVLKAEVYYADGTSDIVTVNTDTGVSGNTIFGMAQTAVDNYTSGDTNKGLYTLEWKDDKAVLKPAAHGGLSDDSEVNVTKNISAAYTESSVDYKYDGKTVFFYVKGTYGDDNNPLSVTVYTGINNVPKSEQKNGHYQAMLEEAISDAGTVKAAYVKSTLGAADGDAVYFYLGTGADKYSKEGSTVYYNVYAKGEQSDTDIELKYDTIAKAETAISHANDAGFYYVNGSNNELTKITSGSEKGSVTYTTGVSVTKANTDAFTLNGTLTLDGTNVVDLRDEEVLANDLDAFADLVKTAASVTVATAVKDGNVTDMYITAST